jgi:hypothetical protein
MVIENLGDEAPKPDKKPELEPALYREDLGRPHPWSIPQGYNPLAASQLPEGFLQIHPAHYEVGIGPLTQRSDKTTQRLQITFDDQHNLVKVMMSNGMSLVNENNTWKFVNIEGKAIPLGGKVEAIERGGAFVSLEDGRHYLLQYDGSKLDYNSDSTVAKVTYPNQTSREFQYEWMKDHHEIVQITGSNGHVLKLVGAGYLEFDENKQPLGSKPRNLKFILYPIGDLIMFDRDNSTCLRYYSDGGTEELNYANRTIKDNQGGLVTEYQYSKTTGRLETITDPFDMTWKRASSDSDVFHMYGGEGLNTTHIIMDKTIYDLVPDSVWEYRQWNDNWGK